MVRRYPLGLSDVGAATSTAGDHSTVRQRRIAAAGAATIADIIADWWVNYSGTGVGLRGGTWTWSGDKHTVLHFTNTRLVPGVAVTGRADWILPTGAVTATVTVTGRHHHRAAADDLVAQPAACPGSDHRHRRRAGAARAYAGAVKTLYRAPFSTNVERVALALAHKGVEVESVVIGYDDRSLVERVSGQPLVPVLVDDGLVVTDSMRIIRHLEARYPDPPLYPSQPHRLAEMLIFIDWFNRVWKVAPNAIEAELRQAVARHGRRGCVGL